MAKKVRGHEISRVTEGSIAWEMGVEPGMLLISVNGQEIEDVFDYQFLMEDTEVDILIREADGEETLLEIEKEEGEDFGIEFSNPLMDEYHSCCNHCIFCFIDQMPKGMRSTLYFKDDDSRLSFLQGNYVTLTNLSDHDIDRIIRYRMEPINVSVQTTNPELRVRMLHNRFAGESFGKMRRLRDAGIAMNGQIVLCKGWNDGKELERSIRDLTGYLPAMQSVSVVPVGLSRYRENLTPLEPFTKEDACQVIDIIEYWQRVIWERLDASYEGSREEPDLMEGAPRHFIHASDEWYILAGRPLPEADRYDGYIQYENGVGMLRALIEETREAIRQYSSEAFRRTCVPGNEKITGLAVTGMLAADYIEMLLREIRASFPHSHIRTFPVRNDFFGEMITVSGLVTGGDLLRQLKEYISEGNAPGKTLLIPVNMLRRGEDIFLDDVSIDDIKRESGLSVRIVTDSGEDLVRAALGLPPLKEDKERQTYE